jgi:imidazolonepropionase-like amidohydrolase
MRLKNLPLILVVVVATALFFRPEERGLLPAWPGYGISKFIRVNAPRIALTHVRVIDGTGAPPISDATILIADGKIQSVGPSQSTSVAPGTLILDLAGRTVIPGIVGMHDHLFYGSVGRVLPFSETEMGFSFPRLYLASGVTTIRTTGAIELPADLRLKQQVDKGWVAGPKIFVTGPYMNGGSNPAAITKAINGWADRGATSFKAYMYITRAELAAAIDATHKRGLKVAGHLCAVGFSEAAALGIDSLEHGLIEDSEFVPNKAPDVCPSRDSMNTALTQLDIGSAPVQETIRDLVQHHVAVTSTLPVFETYLPFRVPTQDRILAALDSSSRQAYLDVRGHMNEWGNRSPWPTIFRKEMQFERAFVNAGGLLLAGCDPTGNGGNLAGFGDQRELELLVEAGFTPLEAIHIATMNGASFLGESDRIGSIAPGKQADLVVVNGDPSTNIGDIERVEIVFKDGVGYDSPKLIASVKGSVG